MPRGDVPRGNMPRGDMPRGICPGHICPRAQVPRDQYAFGVICPGDNISLPDMPRGKSNWGIYLLGPFALGQMYPRADMPWGQYGMPQDNMTRLKSGPQLISSIVIVHQDDWLHETKMVYLQTLQAAKTTFPTNIRLYKTICPISIHAP